MRTNGGMVCGTAHASQSYSFFLVYKHLITVTRVKAELQTGMSEGGNKAFKKALTGERNEEASV